MDSTKEDLQQIPIGFKISKTHNDKIERLRSKKIADTGYHVTKQQFFAEIIESLPEN